MVSPRRCCDQAMYPHPATARHRDMHCCRVGPASWCSTLSPAPASWQPPRHHWHWSCCPLASCSGTMITRAAAGTLFSLLLIVIPTLPRSLGTGLLSAVESYLLSYYYYFLLFLFTLPRHTPLTTQHNKDKKMMYAVQRARHLECARLPS